MHTFLELFLGLGIIAVFKCYDSPYLLPTEPVERHLILHFDVIFFLLREGRWLVERLQVCSTSQFYVQ